MLLVVVLKDGSALALAATALLCDRYGFDLERVVLIWCGCSALGLAAMAVMLMRTWTFSSWAEVTDAGLTALDQYRTSATHFLIGLVAVAALQVDRLVVGALLTLAEAGIYFRHSLLASFVYQLFNVMSYNRLVPLVYAAVQEGRPSVARRTLRRERWILAALGALLAAAVLAIGWIGSRGLVDTRGVDPWLLLPLLAGYAVRALADFRAMLLHASMRERLVFRSQCVALAAAVALYFALGALIGLPGIAIGLILASTVFLALLSWHVRRSPDLCNDGETARA